MKLVEKAQEQSYQILKDKPKFRNKDLKLKLPNNSVSNDNRYMLNNSPSDTAPIRTYLNNIKTNRTNSITDQSFSTAPSGHLQNSNLTFMNSLVVGNQVQNSIFKPHLVEDDSIMGGNSTNTNQNVIPN